MEKNEEFIQIYCMQCEETTKHKRSIVEEISLSSKKYKVFICCKCGFPKNAVLVGDLKNE